MFWAKLQIVFLWIEKSCPIVLFSIRNLWYSSGKRNRRLTSSWWFPRCLSLWGPYVGDSAWGWMLETMKAARQDWFDLHPTSMCWAFHTGCPTVEVASSKWGLEDLSRSSIVSDQSKISQWVSYLSRQKLCSHIWVGSCSTDALPAQSGPDRLRQSRLSRTVS